MLIGKDKIREVVERTDLVALIGRHVQLKKAGRSYAGLCPFHGERTPSFYVTPERRSYKCFGCGKGGDAIRFLMEYEGKDFVSAVRELAQQAGVPLVFDPEEDKRLQERRALLWACDVAARFFEATLWSEAGGPGREHLARRGVSEKTAREARLGYAPFTWQALRDILQREGVPLDVGVAAGLLGFKEPDRYYDTFRGRLMVPIRDPEGRVIAFGGRVIEGDDSRKYINSRETPLYTKSRVLYGLDTAREAVRRGGSVTLVEGYFDAIALREAGIADAVALCSTVLTPEHMKLLERLEVRRVDVLLDGDEAGRRGAVKLAGPLLGAGVSTRVVALPDGHDPDTFLRDHGREGYEALLAQSRPLSSWVIERAITGAGEAYEDRLRALGDLRPVVAALPDGAPRTLFLGEIARHLGVGTGDIAAFFRGDVRRDEPAAPPPQQRGRAPGAAVVPAQRGPARPAPVPAKRRELELVANLVAHPNLRVEFGAAVAARIAHADLRELTGLLVEGTLPEEELLPRLEPGLAQALAARVRAAWSAPEKDWRREIEDGLLHVDFERLQEERRAAIAERERLEAQRLRHPEGSGEYREFEAAIHQCRAQAEALRVEMERVRAQLRATP